MVSKVYIVGCGMGNPGTMTQAAQDAIEASQLLIGAPRLLEQFSALDAEKLPLVASTEIAGALRTSDAKVASVLMSGDIGFYSGATGLYPLLEKLEGVEAKAKYYLNHSLIADMVPSALVSYVGKYAVPGMEEYVDAFLLGGVCSASGLVITAPEGRFCAQIAHKYEDAKLLTAFEKELAAEGIEILHAERNVAQNNIGISLPTE